MGCNGLSLCEDALEAEAGENQIARLLDYDNRKMIKRRKYKIRVIVFRMGRFSNPVFATCVQGHRSSQRKKKKER